MNLTQSILNYADSHGIKYSYPGPYRVTTEWLNIRTGPSTSTKIIGKLVGGDTVMIKDAVGKWYQVEQGWIHSDYLEAV